MTDNNIVVPEEQGQQNVPQMPHQMPMGMKMPMGVKMPMGMKMPMGVKMPMGYPMGMKMPMGYPMGYPMGQQQMPMQNAVPPTPVEEEKPVEEEVPPPAEAEENEEQPIEEEMVADENGIIDDLPEEEEEYVSPYEKNMAADFGLPPIFIQTKMLLFLFFFFTVCGLGTGWFFGQMKPTNTEQVSGIVQNSEILKGRPRCGVAQKGQGCVLFLLNSTREDHDAKYFFQMASDLMQVPKFQIETSNMKYGNTRIPPGYFALINIPPMQ